MSVEVVSPGDIAPGKAGTLRVTLNHYRVRVGRASYPLTVMAGREVVASVPVTYDYDPPIYAEHAELFIDADEPREAKAATTVWVRRPQAAGAAPRVECDSRHFEVKLRESVQSQDGQYRLDVTCTAGTLAAGTAEATVAVYLAGSEMPDLSIPIHCTVRPPVSAHPAALLLGAVGGEVRRVIRLTSRKPFTVESVTASSAQLTVKDKEGKVGGGRTADAELTERSYEVVISPEAGSIGSFEAEIRIVIGGPAGCQLVVPVVAEVLAE